jgi:hypothetical protein
MLVLNCLGAFALSFFLGEVTGQQGFLFPRDSESRESKSLDGIWNFRAEPFGSNDLGITEQWFNAPLSQVI